MTPLEQAIARDASCTWLDKVDVSTLEGADMAAVDRRMLLGLVKQMEADARRYAWLHKGAPPTIHADRASFKNGRGPYVVIDNPGVEIYQFQICGHSLDAAIDRAMEQSK